MENTIITVNTIAEPKCFKRDTDYFNDGYASWVVVVRGKEYHVNAVYQEQALYKNEFTKDYSNGIKSFDIQDRNYNTITNIKRSPEEKKSSIVSLKEVCDFLGITM